jgi:sodium transport system ATP-binding protein
MIHVRDLTKEYDDLRCGRCTALAGISFSAKPGQIYGLLGPNGAGKTTALRILSTVLQPTSGWATINGYDVVTQADFVRHQIGFVSNNTAVYDRMTAWEMVEYFGRLYGLEKDELRRRMEDVFQRLKMNDIRDVLGGKMSTGMKQKVSIARAVVHHTPVLIFHEATVGLLDQFAPGFKIELSLDDLSPLAAPRPQIRASVRSEDGLSTDLEYQGQGVQRSGERVCQRLGASLAE